MNIPKEIADKYQGLFNLMNKEHNLTLTIDEMNEIIIEAEQVKSESISDVTSWLFIDDVAAMYGKIIKYKWLTPDGQDWLQKEGRVNASLLRQMEQGSIKEACL